MTIWYFLLVPFLWLFALFGKRIFELQQLRRQYAVEELSKMHRRQFEKYVAYKLRAKGWKKVKIGKGISDGWRDVEGYLQGQRYIIQCKCYNPNSKIGISKVRELIGVLESQPYTNGIICTTAQFSKPSMKLAKKRGIQLWWIDNILLKLT